MQYIKKESNQPLDLIKHLPASIKKRLSNNFSDEKIFKESTTYYESTLNKAGYKNNFTHPKCKYSGKQQQKLPTECYMV